MFISQLVFHYGTEGTTVRHCPGQNLLGFNMVAASLEVNIHMNTEAGKKTEIAPGSICMLSGKTQLSLQP